mmetsp:Transcript_10121/g.15487  ORF Transcript_10121/g.15487 Transcript_10121/m.15487 type:complete len:121 (-) Transcript_10121:54-416(-)
MPFSICGAIKKYWIRLVGRMRMGSHMKEKMAKQFFELRGYPILHHSCDMFLKRLPEVIAQAKTRKQVMVVLVIDPRYHHQTINTLSTDTTPEDMDVADVILGEQQKAGASGSKVSKGILQ